MDKSRKCKIHVNLFRIFQVIYDSIYHSSKITSMYQIWSFSPVHFIWWQADKGTQFEFKYPLNILPSVP